MWIPAAVVVTGLLAVIFATERYGLRFGGVVVVPLLAMYMLFDYRTLPLFVVSMGAAYVSLRLIETRIVLYGRRLFITAIVTGALVPVLSFLLVQVFVGSTLPIRDIAYLGSILPGIAAYNLHRLDREDQVADVVGSLVLVAGLVALAAFFLIPRAVAAGGPLLEVLLGTTRQMLFAEVDPFVPAPAVILPRLAVVGLFVLGLAMSELARKRYGIRLAGVIAIPLVAVFALQDGRLLWLYLAAIVITAACVRVVHRSTFLYGRNLLAGTCIVGVIVAMAGLSFLPATVGLRPIIVGLLAGVTTYNGHVLAPGERIRAMTVSAGSFVVIFAIADGLAYLTGSPVASQVGQFAVIIGVVAVGFMAEALYDFESLRPAEPIPPIANGSGTGIPDGGRADRDAVLSDGGQLDPLAGRTVTRIGPNARVVSRRPGDDR